MQRDRKTLLKIAETMRKYGGSFASTLALAMLYADKENLRRIEAAFPELMNHYTDFKPWSES